MTPEQERDQAIAAVDVAYRQLLAAIREMQRGNDENLGGHESQEWRRWFLMGYAMGRAECATMAGHALNALSIAIARDA